MIGIKSKNLVIWFIVLLIFVFFAWYHWDTPIRFTYGYVISAFGVVWFIADPFKLVGGLKMWNSAMPIGASSDNEEEESTKTETEEQEVH